MARKGTPGKGSVYRPFVTRMVNGERIKKRTSFYWVDYCDVHGDRKKHVMVLPNGVKIKDKAVAEKVLKAILTRVEHESVGLIDDAVESAVLPTG